jgi:hypothetical protein
VAIRVGDVLPDLGVTTTSNSTGALADPTTVRLTVTLPDGTTKVGTWPAAAGNDARLSDARAPVDGSVVTASLATGLVIDGGAL